MQLTPEQQEQLRHAKANGERRVTLQFTEEQRKYWREAVEQEMAGKEANIAYAQQIRAAAERPGFFGDIRRAIRHSRRRKKDLAAQIGVESQVLSDFCAGDAELPPTMLDRLVEALGLRLMQEIPR